MALNFGALGALMGGGAGITFPCAACTAERAILAERAATDSDVPYMRHRAARAREVSDVEPRPTTTLVLGTAVCDEHASAMLNAHASQGHIGEDYRALPLVRQVELAAERDTYRDVHGE